MIPASYPSVVDENNRTKIVVYFLPSVAGLTKWIDYIPVKAPPDTTNLTVANTFANNGFLLISNMTDISSKQAWKDYVPVFVDYSATTPWSTDTLGYIPMDAFTPAALFAAGEVGTWFDPSDVSLNWRRNLLTYTEQFDNAVWVKGRTAISATNAAVAPDGTTTADKLVDSTDNNTHRVYQVISGAALGTYTFTVYVQAAELTKVTISVTNTVETQRHRVTFDLTGNGSGTTIGGSGSFAIDNVGNNWYKCTVTGTTISGDTGVAGFIYTTASNGAVTYIGTGTDGIYIWGAQLELGATPSDYQRIVTPEISYLDVQPLPILYQDAAGTTPVTAVEQPVSLMLDKSKGLVIGPELVDTMNTAAAWSAYGTNTVADDGANGVKITYVDNGNGAFAYFAAANGLSQNLVLGKYYKITGQVKVSAGNSVVLQGSWTGGAQTLATVTSDTFVNFSAVIIPLTTATDFIRFSGMGTGEIIWIRNISVKEIAGNHAYTPSTASTSRPTLSARYNLLTYSEQFDNAAWTKTNSSIVANAIAAPDGTTTADKLVENTATITIHNTDSSPDLSITSGVGYTGSAYLKAAERTKVIVGMRLGTSLFTGILVDLSDGTFSANWNTAPTSYAITSVGDGWYRVSVTNTANTTGSVGDLRLYLCDEAGNSSYTGDGTSGIYIWGADLRVSNDGTSIPTYQRVTTSTDYDTVNFPPYLRFDGSDDYMLTNSIDFSTVTSDGEARRNLLTFPSAFDNAAWTVEQGTVVANDISAPDGSLTAEKYTENASAGVHGFRNTTGVSVAGNTTGSIYLKDGNRRYVSISLYDGSAYSKGSVIDLQTGTVTQTYGTYAITPTITNAGNGWWRFIITDSITATTFLYVCACDSATPLTTTGRQNRSGDGTSYFYAWGAQLELGSSATDFQDIGTDQMTVFAGVRKLSDAAAGVLFELGPIANTTNGTIATFAPSASRTDYGYVSRGSSLASAVWINSVVTAPNTSVLTGISGISTDVLNLRSNGVLRLSITVDQGSGNYGNYPLYIGRRAGTSNPFNGRLYGLITRGAQSTASEISNTETWMNNKTKAY